MDYNLNQKQIDAVNSNSPQIIVIAPAGSGKTSCLTEAIKKYKNEKPNNTVVAITFTKKAAYELEKRLVGLKGILCSTIHSWAYSELEKLSRKIRQENINSTFQVKLLQDDKIKEILNEILKKRGYTYIKMWQLFSYVMGNYNVDVEDYLKRLFQSIKEEYVKYKQDNGLYDFTDLPLYLYDKLLDYERDIQGIDALFVDEFQDVDDIQLELFNLVKAEKKFYIGDPQQSIYIFRGATEDVLRKLKNFDIYGLDINYRSKQEIIDFATTYQKNAQKEDILFSGQLESYKSSILCDKGNGGEVYILNRMGNAFKVNEEIKINGQKIVEEFIERQSMILCRKNKEVKAIIDLGYANVSTVHQAKGLEYNSVIVTDFEIQGIEDINISYVAMTRAKNHLLAANYERFIKILKKLKEQGKLEKNQFLL